MVNPPKRLGESAVSSGIIAGSYADAGLTGRHPAPCIMVIPLYDTPLRRGIFWIKKPALGGTGGKE